jgi:hypothetical protein
MNGVPMDVQLRNVASARSISRWRVLWYVARPGAAASVCGLGAYGQTIRVASTKKKFVVVTFSGIPKGATSNSKWSLCNGST